jgi:hypothetical protein
MSLALDRDRVRSSVVLERTCRSSTKLIESLATDVSGGSPASATRIEGRLPKLMPRMPLQTQRRKHAYLNPLIERPAAGAGLAIFSEARSSGASDLLTWAACSERRCNSRAPR